MSVYYINSIQWCAYELIFDYSHLCAMLCVNCHYGIVSILCRKKTCRSVKSLTSICPATCSSVSKLCNAVQDSVGFLSGWKFTLLLFVLKTLVNINFSEYICFRHTKTLIGYYKYVCICLCLGHVCCIET